MKTILVICTTVALAMAANLPQGSFWHAGGPELMAAVAAPCLGLAALWPRADWRCTEGRAGYCAWCGEAVLVSDGLVALRHLHDPAMQRKCLMIAQGAAAVTVVAMFVPLIGGAIRAAVSTKGHN